MRVVARKAKPPMLRVVAETSEDLWYLSKIIDAGDLVSAQTTRVFKPERLRPSEERKVVRVELRVKDIEYRANELRISGVIERGQPEEFVARGAHHALSIKPREALTIHKALGVYQLELLKEALKRSYQVVAGVVLIDERQALLARLEARGFAILAELSSGAHKAEPRCYESVMKGFFKKVSDALQSMPRPIIIAGPGFAKEALLKALPRELAKSVFVESTTSATRAGLYELLRRGAVARVVKAHKLQREYQALEELKLHIARCDGLACYGVDDVKRALEAGAVKALLLTESMARGLPELLEAALGQGAQFLIFSEGSPAAEEFKSFAIAALLRRALHLT